MRPDAAVAIKTSVGRIQAGACTAVAARVLLVAGRKLVDRDLRNVGGPLKADITKGLNDGDRLECRAR